MMKIRKVNNNFTIIPQIQPDELTALTTEDFTTMIYNHPNNKEPKQPTLDEMHRTTQNTKLTFHHIPITGNLFPPTTIATFATIQHDTPNKVLNYYHTNTRSITLDTLT